MPRCAKILPSNARVSLLVQITFFFFLHFLYTLSNHYLGHFVSMLDCLKLLLKKKNYKRKFELLEAKSKETTLDFALSCPTNFFFQHQNDTSLLILSLV